ncbi:30S ribosomal protein S15 [Candidatus Woesearchaeota archaeon]|nr:30S ribosomal protein S15 [Candidatus Woesearchaeota archaeon]
MARLYSKSKGKASSHKPVDRTVPEWVNYSPTEVEQIIVKLAKQENTASKIGMFLRDSYGIPSVKALLNKSINDVLKDKKLTPKLPEDLLALIKRHIAVMNHANANKHDVVAKRGVTLVESKIKRLANYYKTKNILPNKWVYDRTQAKLYIE